MALASLVFFPECKQRKGYFCESRNCIWVFFYFSFGCLHLSASNFQLSISSSEMRPRQ